MKKVQPQKCVTQKETNGSTKIVLYEKSRKTKKTICNMSLGQHEKSATCKKCNTTKLQYETTILQNVHHENNAT